MHTGQHEAHEVGALFHWLRDAALAIPLAAAAVYFGSLLVDGRVLGTTDRLVWALGTALFYALVTIPGNLAHGALFGAEHAVGGNVVPHLLRDAAAAFMPALLLLALAAFATRIPGERRIAGATRARNPRVALSGRSAWVTIVAGATMATALTALPAPGPFPDTTPAAEAQANVCNRQIYADVVALDQVIVYNRLGAVNPNGLMYALRRDVVAKDGGELTPGNVMLRPDKRPRPLVLRANVGDCITVDFENLLDPAENGPCPPEVVAPDSWDGQPHGDWPCDRHVGMHVNDMQLVDSIASDGSFVGKNGLNEDGTISNKSGIVAPGEATTYQWYAEYENTFLLYNQAVTVASEGSGGTAGLGLFGAFNVEPVTTVWYRSQLTRQEMDWAATDATGTIQLTPGGQPIIDYDAVYPAGTGGGKDGLPIVAMLDNVVLKPDGSIASGELVHTDINAIISGPESNNYKIPTEAYTAGYWENANYPGGEDPFREYTVVFQDDAFAVQAFPQFSDPAFAHTLHGVQDAFPINYGSGGIGSEIIANRLGLGPMANCTECKYEEFFLTSWVVGDPAMIVDIPASSQVNPDGSVVPEPERATKALYPDDPSNVHHSYLNDRVKSTATSTTG
jgi:hypothetical protein